MKKLNKNIVNCLENNDIYIVDISLQDNDFIAELEFSSNLGEDVIVDIWYNGNNSDFIKQFSIYADDFDVDEHIEPYISMRGENGVPGSISDLLRDAEEIQEFLEKVANELQKI